MGERSMAACLQEQVDAIRDALPPHVPTFRDWYDEGMPDHVFATDGTVPPTVSYAIGYLTGAADLADETLLNLLDQHDVLTCQIVEHPDITDIRDGARRRPLKRENCSHCSGASPDPCPLHDKPARKPRKRRKVS